MNHLENMGTASIGVVPTQTHHHKSAAGFAKLSNYFFEQGLKIKDKPELHAKYHEVVQSLVAVRNDLQHVYHQEEHILQLEYRVAELLRERIELQREVEKLTKTINFE